MSENYASTPELEKNAPPNSQIQGVNHAANPNFFPTINVALGRPNVELSFKCDLKHKKMYNIQAENWSPVNSTTQAKWDLHKKKYKLTANETVEQMTLEENAKYPDGTFKYYISYKTCKRMQGADGNEYLVRGGYLHGISFMNLEWKYPKSDFDFHY